MAKTVKFFVLAITLTALAAVSAVAKDDHKSAKFTFGDNSSIYNTNFKRGEYKIRFYESTNKVEVLKDNEVVLTTTGHKVMENEEFDNNALLTKTMENGVMMLTGVRFKGERWSVMFDDPVAAGTHHETHNLELFDQ